MHNFIANTAHLSIFISFEEVIKVSTLHRLPSFPFVLEIIRRL